MILQYVRAAMERAHYEIIDDLEPYYGEIPECEGVWATGKTLEECRRNLEEVLEGWIVVRLQRRLSIPHVGACCAGSCGRPVFLAGSGIRQSEVAPPTPFARRGFGRG